MKRNIFRNEKAFVPSLLLAMIVYCLSLTSSANAAMIFSSINQDSLSVGDRIHLSISMLVPKNSQVVPPPTDNGFGQFIVKEWTSDKTEKKSADSLTFNYIVTTYTAEPCTIPSLPFLLTYNNKSDTLHSDIFPLRTVLVPPSSAHDTAIIRDIKKLESAGSPSLLWVWLILCAAVIVSVVFLLKRFIKRKSKPAFVPPQSPPYEEAMESLRLLDAKQYLVKGMIREYVFELSDIVKRYLERRYQTNAAELTTEEMLDWIRVSPLDSAHRRVLEWFFSASDPVKFAKQSPNQETIERFGTDIRAFLEATKPQPDKKEKGATVATA